MNLKELQENVKRDLELNLENFEEQMYKKPNHFSKYSTMWVKHKIELGKLEKQFNMLYKKKYHYYTHEFEYSLKNQKEILFYVEGDEEVCVLHTKLENKRTLVEYLDRVTKRVETMSFDIKNIIEYQKYIRGV